MHQELQDLLKDLDYYKYSNFDSDKVAEIEAEIIKYGDRFNGQGEGVERDAYIAYPEYSDPDFYGKIFRKKEFNKTLAGPLSKSLSYEDVANSKCSSQFRITNNQAFLKNFISPATQYNGILLYHGVGVGKCFRRNTPILMYDGTLKVVQDVVVGDLVMGDNSSPRKVLSLSPIANGKLYTIDQKYGESYSVNSEHILTLVSPKGVVVDICVSDFCALPEAEQEKWQSCQSKIVFFPKQQVVPSDNVAYRIGVLFSDSKLADYIKYGSPQVRSAFLAGYIDVWGQIVDSRVCIPWNECVLFVARSLAIGTQICGSGNYYVLLDGHMLSHVCTKKIYMGAVSHSDFHRISVRRNLFYENYYGFEVDGNHRFLLGDFTVTHNSCSAISIAEQFTEVFDKRVLTLMPSNLKENFKKQIFDINKGPQCTWNKYRNMLGEDGLTSKDILEKRANRIINDTYQFLGFQEFANGIIRVRESLNNESQFVSYIKQQYSNRVMIIDEVHNVREGEDGLDKLVPPILLQVIQHAENVKLVLLSATPMFNEASEIVWLINLLLANDKRPLLQTSDIFSGDGKLKEGGRDLLVRSTKGYISYMQGENPFSFPFRLYPSVNGDKNIQKSPPKFDIKGEPIKPALRLSKLELIESKMSKQQIELFEAEKEGNDQTNNQLTQISNIVFPNGLFGAAGIKNSFNKDDKYTYSYKKGVAQFLGPDLISEYAPKIERITEYIAKSVGICFVYSFFIDSGIIPMAMALEHIGFSRYNGKNLLTGISPRPAPFMINGKQACYSIISARKELTPDFDGDIDVARSDENANGEIIKVILGSSVSAEGIDFKCIREMHMLDPWYNLNKMEQIFGRGIRNCSHINLPPRLRNVTLYHHICVDKASSNESIDERVYRIAENKQADIDEVERILRSIAVDCHLNVNMFAKTNIKLDIETSQKVSVKNYPIQPNKFKEEGKCIEKISETPIDESTFNKHFYLAEIEDLAATVAGLYLKRHFYTYEEIAGQLVADNDILMYTLDYMLETKYVVFHGADVPGYLIYRSNIYLFQPRSTGDLTMPLSRRYQYEGVKVNTLTITSAAVVENVQNQKKDKTLDVVGEVEKSVAGVAKAFSSFGFDKQVFYDFVIDRLDWDHLFKLATRAETGTAIYNSLVDAKVITGGWIRNVFSNEPEFYHLDSGKKVTPREIENTVVATVEKMEVARLKGYVDITKKTPKFKIMDSVKTKSTGFVCAATSTLKIDELRTMIKPLKSDPDIKKPVLCDIYELKLRQSGTNFARPYIAIVSLGLKIKKTESSP